jgi:hypothetical protein
MLHALKQLIKKVVKRVFQVGGFNVVRPIVLEQLAGALERQERVAGELATLQRMVADLSTSAHELKDTILGQREPRQMLGALQRLAAAARGAANDGGPDAETLRGLAHHYALCANLVAELRLFERRPAQDPFFEDDGTVEFTKRVAIYVPGNEVDVEPGTPTFPWTDMFADPRCAVFLILGQSNAANHGEGRYRPTHEVYTLNFLDMKCYRGNDPLPGASGTGGSVWSRLGDLLVSAGLYDRVLFVPLAFGGTFVRDWTPGGSANKRLALALSRLQKWLGQEFLSFTAVVWQQGEAEANHTSLSERDYRQSVLQVIADLRSRGVFSPVFSTISTLCEAGAHEHQNHETIRRAQRLVSDAKAGIILGPDTDTIGVADRTDGCHFSASGLAACTQLWFEVFKSRQTLLHTGEIAFVR